MQPNASPRCWSVIIRIICGFFTPGFAASGSAVVSARTSPLSPAPIHKEDFKNVRLLISFLIPFE